MNNPSTWDDAYRTVLERKVRKALRHAGSAPRGARRTKLLDQVVRETQALILVERFLELDDLERAALRLSDLNERLGEITADDVHARVRRVAGDFGLLMVAR